MRTLLKRNSGVIWFSLFKYLEIVVTAVTTFLVAKKIGPKEMGLSIPVLLYITYANYLSLGVNQVVTKNLSKFKNEVKIRNFITINFQYIMIVSLLNLIFVFFFLDHRYALFAGLVSVFSILRGFFSSYYRAIYRVKVLNKNNLIFSIALLSSVFLFVDSIYDYLFYWAICLAGTLLLYTLDGWSFFTRIFRNLFFLSSRKEILYNLKEGSKLAIAGLSTTILLTSDRFLVNKINIPLEMKGSYQLADYVGTALYMCITTIVFYFYPKWIENIRNNEIFRRKFVRFIKLSLIGIPFFFFFVFFGSKIINSIFFSEYLRLDEFVIFTVYIKTAVIYLSLTSLYYTALDSEAKYILSLKFLFIALSIFFCMFFWFSNIDFIMIPGVLGTLIFIEAFRKIFKLSDLKKSTLELE